MKRNFATPENMREQFKRTYAERRLEVYNCALAKDNHHAAEKVVQSAFAPALEYTPHHGSETGVENHEGHAGIIERLEGHIPKIKVADGEAPIIQQMLENILADDGGRIVERLNEAESKIADAGDCKKPEFGRLIEAHYVPLLMSALALSDEEFDAAYPGEGRASAEQRKTFAEAIQRHCAECPRCSAKFSSDMVWDAHLDGVASRAKHRSRIPV